MPQANGSRSSAQTHARRRPAIDAKQPGPDYWYIDDILDERDCGNSVEYLVRWQEKDPRTLQAWPLEWIPRSWVNKAAERSWQKRKRTKAGAISLPNCPTTPALTSNTIHEGVESGSSHLKQIAPGAYVQVANLSAEFPEDIYPVIEEFSQTSSEGTIETQSWRESPSQHSSAYCTQLESSSELCLSLFGPTEAFSPTTGYSDQHSSFRGRHTIPSSSCATSDADSCSIRQLSITNSNPDSATGLDLISIGTIPSAQIVTPHVSRTVPNFFTQISGGATYTVRAHTSQDSGGFISLSSSPSSTIHSFHTPLNVTIIRESPNGGVLQAVENVSQSSTPSKRHLSVVFPARQLGSGSGFNSQGSISQQHLSRKSTQESSRDRDQDRLTVLRPATPHDKTSNMSSTTNGRMQSFPSPPMQDRVRSIRNSAISTQNRRTIGDENSPVSSRSNSLAPESGRAKASNEIRADSRPPESAMNYQFVDQFPEGSDTSESSITAKFELTLPPNGDNMEYFLALPLPSRVKSQYDATIKLYKTPMAAFLEGVLDSNTVQSMQKLVERLNNVSTHIDLENEEWARTQNEPAEDQAKWALSSASKFVFLQSLCNALRDENMHVVVVAQAPRLLFILEKFMQGIKIDYVRPDNGKKTFSNSQSRLKVSLIQPSAESQKGPWSTANVVVAFDGSFDASAKHIKALRANSTVHGGLAPVIHPLVYCSAEHLSKCIDGLEGLRTDQDKLRALIFAIDERQLELGEMQDEDFRAEAAGEEVAQFVAAGSAKNLWTLVPVRPVKVLSLESILPEDISPEPEAAGAGQGDIGSPSRKRHSEDMLYEESQKRQRMTPIEETTHISDSTIASQNAQITELRQAIETIESANKKSEQQIASLQVTLSEKEQSLVEKGRVIDNLQHRYEKSKRSIVRLVSDKGALEAKIQEARERFEKLDTTKKFFIEESKKLTNQLDEARGELSRSAIPEVSQLEQLRSENRELQGDKEKLERKAKGVSQDFEFTRQQYQQASTAAAEHAQRVHSLEEENEMLRRKASENAIRAREMNNRQEMDQHLAENARLVAELEELKEQLKRKERGRGMTTRTGSAAPRSPRLGTSPGRSRAGSRAPGSRPGSPVRSVHGPRRRGNPLENL